MNPLRILSVVTMHMPKADSKCVLAHAPWCCMSAHIDKQALSQAVTYRLFHQGMSGSGDSSNVTFVTIELLSEVSVGRTKTCTG